MTNLSLACFFLFSQTISKCQTLQNKTVENNIPLLTTSDVMANVIARSVNLGCQNKMPENLLVWKFLFRNAKVGAENRLL